MSILRKHILSQMSTLRENMLGQVSTLREQVGSQVCPLREHTQDCKPTKTLQASQEHSNHKCYKMYCKQS